MDLGVGTVIGGRYRLDRLLGEGGMGTVWAATHTITGGCVALKFVKAASEARAEMRKRFEREARAATLVEHPNVVAVRDIFDHDDTPVIVMDLLHGDTLAALLAREGRLDLGDAARLMLPVISAVGAAHAAGLIHRDLKPENVFVSRGAAGEMVRVLDFGIAKLVRRDDQPSATNVTESGTIIGTPAYMAPEQLFGEKDLDYGVDVWAIGVMLYELLSGARPVDGGSFGELAKNLLLPIAPLNTKCPTLPADVVELVGRMLTRERDRRLRDLREAAEVLARHDANPTPSFGAPRPRPAHDSDAEARIVVSTGTDPSAPTVQISSQRSASQPSSRTPPPHVTRVPSPVRSAWPLAVGVAIALVVAGVVFASRRRASVAPDPSAPIAAPVAATSSIPSTTSTISVGLIPSVTASAVPALPVASTTSAATTKLAIKPAVATAVTASVSAAPPSPPPVPPPVSATNKGGSGLATETPF